jgi:rare lipoprotein A
MKMLVISCALGALVTVAVRSEGAPPSLPTPDVTVIQQAEKQVGISSWYGEECEGNPTASGEIFDMNGLTAAHNTLPLGTWIRVTNLKNGRSVVLRVNDRGPGIPGRLLDVSMEAARQLQFVPNGLTQVQIELIGYVQPHRRNPGTQVSSRWVEGPVFDRPCSAALAEGCYSSGLLTKASYQPN